MPSFAFPSVRINSSSKQLQVSAFHATALYIVMEVSAGDRVKWSRVVTIGKPQSDKEGRTGRQVFCLTRPGATADPDSTLPAAGGGYRKIVFSEDDGDSYHS